MRQPAFAGLFYPDEPAACQRVARSYVDAGVRRSSPAEVHSRDQSRRPLIGAIVPHAGWVCSGAVAGESIGAVAASLTACGIVRPDVVVVFGAVHSAADIEDATLDEYARWDVPGGSNDVRNELRAKLQHETRAASFRTDNRFHRREHAVEVELPLIEAAWPGPTGILPVEVPLIDAAPQVGVETARRVSELGLRAVFLASSDLTHYGPSYGFAPGGAGLRGLAWAKENDRRLLERIERMQVEGIVGAVRDEYNACGGGAIAAMLAACRELGATRATVLRHTNSYEVLSELSDREQDNAVGYAAVVVG